MNPSESNAKKTGGTFRLFHLSFATLAVFLLPLKFGNIVGVPEIPLFWDGIFMWIFESYPPSLFPILSSVLLVSSIIASRGEESFVFDGGFFISLSWGLVASASLIGFAGASVKDFPITYCLHFFGLAIFAFSIMFTLRMDERARRILPAALVLGSCAAVFISLHQLLWGFQNSIEFVRARELATGVKASRDLWLRLEQTRVFAPFSLCNSLGAHLILLMPASAVLLACDKTLARLASGLGATILFLFFYENGARPTSIAVILIYSFILAMIVTRFFNEKWRIIRFVVSSSFTILMLYILKHTYSRGAAVSLAFALFTLPFFARISKKAKFAYCLVVLLLSGTFFMAVNQDRSILQRSSLHARGDYWICALKIFMDKPILGTGWGDFFHEYTRFKAFPGDEAPHSAHNIAMDFASQCGVAGLASVALLFYFTTRFTARSAAMRRPSSKDEHRDVSGLFPLGAFLGIFAWLLHSLCDINFQVPGTAASAIVLSLCALEEGRTGRVLRRSFQGYAKFALLLICTFIIAAGVRLMRFEKEFERLRSVCELTPGEGQIKAAPSVILEAALLNAVKLAPYSPYPWATAGNYAQSLGMWAEAERYFSEALKRSPERASFYARLAYCQLSMGKFDEASGNFLKASRLFPNNKEYREQYIKLQSRF